MSTEVSRDSSGGKPPQELASFLATAPKSRAANAEQVTTPVSAWFGQDASPPASVVSPIPLRGRTHLRRRPASEPRFHTRNRTSVIRFERRGFGVLVLRQFHPAQTGLEQITSVSGGVILDLGDNGRSLWFASTGSGGSTYTDPAGEFSALVKNSGGGWTRTLTDGTQIIFNSGALKRPRLT